MRRVSGASPADVTLSPMSVADGGFTPVASDDSFFLGGAAGGAAQPFEPRNAGLPRPADLVQNLLNLSQSVSPADPLRGVFEGLVACVLGQLELEGLRNKAQSVAASFATAPEPNDTPGNVQQQLFSAADAAISAGRPSEVLRPMGQNLVRVDIQICNTNLQTIREWEDRLQNCRTVHADSARVLSSLEEQKRQLLSDNLASLQQSIAGFAQAVEKSAQQLQSESQAAVNGVLERARAQEQQLLAQLETLSAQTAQKVETMQTRLKGIAMNSMERNERLLAQISKLDEYDDGVIELEQERSHMRERIAAVTNLLNDVNLLFRQCSTVRSLEGKLRTAALRQEESQKLFSEVTVGLQRQSSPKSRPPPPPPSPAHGHEQQLSLTAISQSLPHVMLSMPPVRNSAITVGAPPEQPATNNNSSSSMAQGSHRPAPPPRRSAGPAVNSRPATSGQPSKRRRSESPEQQFHPSALDVDESEAVAVDSGSNVMGKFFGLLKRVVLHVTEPPWPVLDSDEQSDDDRSAKKPRMESRSSTENSSPRRADVKPSSSIASKISASAGEEAWRNHVQSMERAISPASARSETAAQPPGVDHLPDTVSDPARPQGELSPLRVSSDAQQVRRGSFTVRPGASLLQRRPTADRPVPQSGQGSGWLLQSHDEGPDEGTRPKRDDSVVFLGERAATGKRE
jgi:hypothetical protein